MSDEEPLSRLPFSVVLASYCIEFHERNLCSRCTDTDCPRLEVAAMIMDWYRAGRLKRHLRNRRSI